jgi:signal recognition particle subunit SRP68
LLTTSLIQVVTYALILKGPFLRAKEQLEDGLSESPIRLAVARFLPDELAAGSAGASRDRALATLFSDEIGPEIRYCTRELGRGRGYDVDAVVGKMAGKYRNQVVGSV